MSGRRGGSCGGGSSCPQSMGSSWAYVSDVGELEWLPALSLYSTIQAAVVDNPAPTHRCQILQDGSLRLKAGREAICLSFLLIVDTFFLFLRRER